MLSKLTNNAMRGSPWPATLDEAYLTTSIDLARASTEERRWRERVRHLCDRRYLAEDENSAVVREEDPRQRGDSEVLRVQEDRTSGGGLSGYQEVEEGRSAGSNGIARYRG